ncbi:energy-coupling factor transporter transmembrane protein EcfT [Bartonella taylorii]|uniref:Energy-coupling factor transporter transmembrane protein EcfT n=2 Tax=Bartonella taylorii TaxID=33046 RepID=A0A9Q8YY30_BARTA|nr:energy-coupling factor transporter transmembrane protein EcfT [Bartonella taylorii]USP01837.1 energy-coupling factor transporter transmembrane protein EcfT [Bartonella taylorii]USP03166.1 energy-coupling factor transporter transmembrane protein EcfT [Bartonella taylorii]
MIGLYLPRDTFIHKLKPSIKLLFFAVCGTTLLMVSSIPFLVFFLLLAALFYKVAKIPFSTVIKQLKSIGFFLVIIFVFQVIFVNWLEGVEVVLRLIILFSLSSLISLTTKVSDMVDSIQAGLQPFRCFGINPSKVTMVISMAIRFIPLLSEKFNEVREAQRARGLNSNIAALAIPLIIKTIRMASEVAEALEARCYNVGAVDKVSNDKKNPHNERII